MTLWDFSFSALRDHCEKRGYALVKLDSFPWETPAAFSRRHGYHDNWLCKQQARKKRIPPFERDEGAGGRLVRLRSNPALEEWAKRKDAIDTTHKCA